MKSEVRNLNAEVLITNYKLQKLIEYHNFMQFLVVIN